MLLALAPLVALIAAQEDRPAIEVYDLAFGKVYHLSVTRATLAKTPAWKEDADNPPLPARKAVKLADGARAGLFQDTDEWEWHRESVELRDAGDIVGAKKVLEENAGYLSRQNDALAAGAAPAPAASISALDKLEAKSRDAAENLEGDNWEKTRKVMRQDQHKSKVQQAY